MSIKPKRLALFSHPSRYLWILPAVVAFAAQRLLAGHPAFVERFHARAVFRYLSIPISYLTSLVPFSLTELFVVAGIPALLTVIIIWLVRLIRRPGKAARLGRGLRLAAWCLSSAYLLFMLLHGLNYARMPVTDSFRLPARKRSAEELAETAAWLSLQASQVRTLCEEDPSGVFRLRGGIQAALRQASDAYTAAAADYPVLAGPRLRPKGVLLSHYWSYTGISGLYMPLLVESNINIDMPEYLIPETTLHEIAHTRGFAREDEAGFMAFLTGLYSDDPDFAYSVLLGAALRSLNALYGVDRDRYQEAVAGLSDGVWRDLRANNDYWKQFEGPVQEASTKVNDAYLQANLQEDGVRSYGRMVDLVLAWYEDQRDSGTLEKQAAARFPAG